MSNQERIPNMDMELIKSALKNNTDLDFTAIHGDSHFSYFPKDKFNGKKCAFFIGCNDVNIIVSAIRALGEDGKITVVSEDFDELNVLENRLESVKEELGFCNWELLCVSSYDLKVDPDIFKDIVIPNLQAHKAFQNKIEEQKNNNPFIIDEIADIVYIDLLNRYTKRYSDEVIAEGLRILKKRGVLLVNVCLSDEPISKALPTIRKNVRLKYIPAESEMEGILFAHGCFGISYIWKSELPQFISNQVEIRPYIMQASKGKQGICLEKGHAVFYAGPWKEVMDDDGHKLLRGQRVAVCEKTYRNLTSGIYTGQTIGVLPYNKISDSEASLFDCDTRPTRSPKVTKGLTPLNKESADSDINESKCC